MSFSFDAKTELCKLPIQRLCCARAEVYGILLFCNTFNNKEIRIITGNEHFASRLPRLFKRAFHLCFDGDPRVTPSGKMIFSITQPEKIVRIINLFGYSPSRIPVIHINFGVLEEDCCRSAFLRGAFFAGGSITDPTKRYHLELATSHLQVSRELAALLFDMEFPPKSVIRNGNYVTYFKQSDHVEDFLTRIGAPVAAMEIMSAKLEKDLRNSVNRRLNCDSANLDKAVDAAQEQMEAIRLLAEKGKLKQLSEKLQKTAATRMKHPEYTLSELAMAFEPPISKSGLNHRLRKLIQLSKLD